MKKSVKPSDFNFDELEEIKIYTYTMYKLNRRKKEYKDLKEKFISYDEWKDNHAIKKYENITLKSLYNVKRMLQKHVDKSAFFGNSTIGVLVPILLLMINPLINLMELDAIKIYQNIGSVIIMIYILFMMIDDLKKTEIRKELYKDYIEIVNELISKKK